MIGKPRRQKLREPLTDEQLMKVGRRNGKALTFDEIVRWQRLHGVPRRRKPKT